MPHSHRASSLKQSNKSHKTSKASKRSINRLQGGKTQNRVSIKKKGGNGGTIKSKADRMHIAKQRRDASRDKLWQQKRVQGRLSVRNSDTAIVPRIVGIISLSEAEAELETCVKDFLVDGADTKIGQTDGSSSATVTYSKYKKEGHVTFLTNTTAFRSIYQNDSVNEEDASVLAALDLCRICDVVVFLMDGRDSDKSSNIPISGMNVGGGISSTASSTTAQQQDYDHLISSRGDRILSTIKAQGLPTPVTLLVNFEGESDEDTMSMASYQSVKSVRRSAIKKKLELKKYLARFATTEFGEGASKVMEIDIPLVDDSNDNMKDENSNTLTVGKSKKVIPETISNQDTDPFPTRASLIRALCTMNALPPKWVADMPRSYIVSNNNGENNGHEYDKSTQELKITGFIRGKIPFNVNSIVHVPNVGTFGVKEVLKTTSPSIQKRLNKTVDSSMTDDSSNVLASCDITKREPLDMFANPDALEGEQNLIGFDDENHNFNDDEGMDDKNENEGFARPAGWNDYQSAWLDAINDDIYSDDGIDHGELAAELNRKKSDATVITGIDMDAEDDKLISEEERRALVEQRKKDRKEDLDFPDEVQVGEDENARDRFARYRSLKSFRKSYWDPKENLPESYASIYHFGSFRATQADIMADMKDVMEASEARFSQLLEKSKESKQEDEVMDDDSHVSDEDILEGYVASGTHVALVLENVSPTAAARIHPSSLLTAVTLLPHENKVSVIHMGLCENTQCDKNEAGDMPIKSKDVIIFRCGWRTWQARPIFSQNNLNCDKHKFERFMPTGGSFFASSVLGPVTYTPCPVLAFRKTSSGKTQFVALGSVLGADADRIVVKRIVLTGYPTRVHKRHATVKYMFYNPDDVKWFKPAELVTKHGLRGNITDSVGDHGTMKCLFNAPIKQHDTVCLHLYKRIYPKFAPLDVASETGEKVSHSLLVL